MKAYLITTGIIFGLIVVAHAWRMFAESWALAKDPWFLALTFVAAGVSIWAFGLAGKSARERSRSRSNDS